MDGMTPKADTVAVTAVDVAREALLADVDPADVGDHLAAEAEGDRVVTHLFDCRRPGYVGWRWSVTVVRAARQKTVTIAEIVLVPGADAIVAPTWVPYRERIKPGDLSPGDLLPVADDDPRLVPTYSFGDDPLDPDARAQIRTVAKDLGWTRHERAFGELDVFSQGMAAMETKAHLDLLVARGEATAADRADGVVYTAVD